MSPAANVFRIGAFVALAILVRHAQRTQGTRAATIFVAYLATISCFREWVIWLMSRAVALPPPFSTDARLGHLGPINLLVVAGWLFTILLAFALAKQIQRRSFPGTNIFFTLALAALVTTTISYAVEVTGMRVPLWQWSEPRVVTWLPLGWPVDAFEGWATMSFITLLLYAAVRYRLFSPVVWRSAASLAGVMLFFGLSIAAEAWVGHQYRPWRLVVGAYLILAVALGFTARPGLLGSSDAALRDRD